MIWLNIWIFVIWETILHAKVTIRTICKVIWRLVAITVCIFWGYPNNSKLRHSYPIGVAVMLANVWDKAIYLRLSTNQRQIAAAQWSDAFRLVLYHVDRLLICMCVLHTCILYVWYRVTELLSNQYDCMWYWYQNIYDSWEMSCTMANLRNTWIIRQNILH